MHGDNSFVITTGKLVRAQNIFGIVVSDLQQTFVLTLLRFLRINALGYLHINQMC